jgi:hypothetical protein
LAGRSTFLAYEEELEMHLEVHVPANQGWEGIHGRLAVLLGAYGKRVSWASLRLEDGVSSATADEFGCCIELQVYWWGMVSVRGVGRDRDCAINHALAELEDLLVSFVDDLPVDRLAG